MRGKPFGGCGHGHTHPQFARRHVAAEERQPRSALLLLPTYRRRQLPLNLDAIWPRAAPGDFGLVARIATCCL